MNEQKSGGDGEEGAVALHGMNDPGWYPGGKGGERGNKDGEGASWTKHEGHACHVVPMVVEGGKGASALCYVRIGPYKNGREETLGSLLKLGELGGFFVDRASVPLDL